MHCSKWLANRLQTSLEQRRFRPVCCRRSWSKLHSCRRFAGFIVPKRHRQGQQQSAPRSSLLSPSDLSAAIRVTSQGRDAQDLRLWREYAEAALFHAGVLSPKQMAYISNAFARALVPERNVFRRFADSAIEKCNEFEPRDIALFLNAYSKMDFRDETLFEAFSKTIQSSSEVGFGEQQLALVSNAYARLELKDVPLFQTLSGWIVDRKYEFTPQGIAMVSNAFAKLELADAALFSAVSVNIGRHIDVFSPQHVSNLLNAFAKVNIRDIRTLNQLVLKIPQMVYNFKPVELAAATHALVKLGFEDHFAFAALAKAFEKQAPNLRARQLATCLHSFSTLTFTYGKLFSEVVPSLLANVTQADDQSNILLFCAYARVGKPHGQLIRLLLDQLSPRIQEFDELALVSLFYACGRFGLSSETASQHIAARLEKKAPSLSAQHLCNCIYACGRLGLGMREYAGLLEALHRRLTRGDLDPNAQQYANILYALAMVHSRRGEEAKYTVAYPTRAMAVVVKQVTEFDGWMEHPRLLASVAVSCAKLNCASAQLFKLVSDTVQCANFAPSRGLIAELLSAFGTAGFFDLSLFTWSLDKFLSPGLQSTPISTLMKVIHALDMTNRSSTAIHDVSMWPDRSQSVAQLPSILFPQCPPWFQHRVLEFCERVGLVLLGSSASLPAEVLTQMVRPFAGMRMLNVAPFDIFSSASQLQAISDAESEVSDSQSFHQILEDCNSDVLPDHDLFPGTISQEAVPSLSAPTKRTALEYLLEEIHSPLLPSSSSTTPDTVSAARQLTHYVGFLKMRVAPSLVLDPLIRCMTEKMAAQASSLSLPSLALSLCALADVQICPRNIVNTFTQSAEMKFKLLCDSEDDHMTQVAAVSSICSSLPKLNAELSKTFLELLVRYVEGLAAAGSPVEWTQCPKKRGILGPQPLSSFASLVSLLHREELLSPPCLHRLLITALQEGVILTLSPRSGENLLPCPARMVNFWNNFDSMDAEKIASLFKDMAIFFMSLLPLGSHINESESLLVSDTATLTALLLVQMLPILYVAGDGHKDSSKATIGTSVHVSLLLDLLRSMTALPLSRWNAGHLALCTSLLESLAGSAETIGSQSATISLQMLGDIQIFSILADLQVTDRSKVVTVAAGALSRCLTACGFPQAVLGNPQLKCYPNPQEAMPRHVATMMRSVLNRMHRLNPNEGAKAAYFCAMALDASVLSDAQRSEASAGLAQLLERVCWERQSWSPEDRHRIATVGMLLRSEYPELLHKGWVSRSVLTVLEDLRSETEPFSNV